MTVKVLFVCLGNICRSPAAEGFFRAVLRDNGLDRAVEVDSRGTAAHHIGEPPDPRSQSAALARGVDISNLRAGSVQERDFDRFDYILAMDRQNLRDLQAMAPSDARATPRLFLDYAPNQPDREVPDPYYGGASGFEHVLDLIERASPGLLADIRKRFGDRLFQ